jgi:hypothetical protein
MVASFSFELDPENTVVGWDCEGVTIEQCVFRWTSRKFAAIGTKLKI